MTQAASTGSDKAANRVLLHPTCHQQEVELGPAVHAPVAWDMLL